MQNGLGLLRNTASSSATQVSVFSPPESSEMLQASLPGGRATISMPHSSTSSASSTTMSASPPPNSRRNSSWKWPRTVSSVARNSCRLSTLIRWMIRSSDGLGVDQVAVLLREVAEAGFELVEFVEGIEVDRADVVELVAEFGDFAFDCVAVRPRSARSLKRASLGCSRSLGCCCQVDAVVVLHPFDERLAFVAELVGGDVELVVLRLEGGELLAVVADALLQLLPRCAEALVGVGLLGELGGLVLLDEKQLGQRLPAGEHRGVELGELRLPSASRLAHVGQALIAFLLIALGLFQLGAQHFDALLALGGGDSSARSSRPAVPRAAASNRLQLERRSRLFAFELGGRFRGGDLSFARRLDFVLARPRIAPAIDLQLAFDAVRRRGTLVRAGRGRRPSAGDARQVRRRARRFGRRGGELLLLAGAVVFEPGMDDLLVGELLLEFGELLVAGAQLAAPREHAGRGLPRADDERAVGRQQFAVAGDELQAAAGGLGEPQRRRQPVDEPGAAQQPLAPAA